MPTGKDVAAGAVAGTLFGEPRFGGKGKAPIAEVPKVETTKIESSKVPDIEFDPPPEKMTPQQMVEAEKVMNAEAERMSAPFEGEVPKFEETTAMPEKVEIPLKN